MADGPGVQVAVCDQAVSYRRGLGTVLAAAGFVMEDVADLRADPSVVGVAALLLTVRSSDDWAVLRRVRAVNADVTVVALLVDPTIDRHAEALRCGAHGVVAWEAPPESIVTVLSAALERLTVLPTGVAQAISDTGPPLHDPSWLSAEEVQWLKLLAQGVTVQELALHAGFSERALYRVLHGLYARMGVSGRTEAILLASRHRLFEQEPSG